MLESTIISELRSTVLGLSGESVRIVCNVHQDESQVFRAVQDFVLYRILCCTGFCERKTGCQGCTSTFWNSFGSDDDLCVREVAVELRLKVKMENSLMIIGVSEIPSRVLTGFRVLC